MSRQKNSSISLFENFTFEIEKSGVVRNIFPIEKSHDF